MNKKILVIGAAVIMLCLVAAVVFADGAGVSYTSKSVKVWNTGKGIIDRVDVCIRYTDAAGTPRETSDSFYKVTKTGETRPFTMGTVIGAYSTFCTVPLSNGD
jgi:hypothetical protein